MSLFDDTPPLAEPPRPDSKRPLAERMRPERLEDYIGQEHILGPGKLLRRAVEINRDCAGLTDDDYVGDPRRVKLEASGNVNLKTIRAIAETGVDYISTSKITMAAPTLDIGLDVVID